MHAYCWWSLQKLIKNPLASGGHSSHTYRTRCLFQLQIAHFTLKVSLYELGLSRKLICYSPVLLFSIKPHSHHLVVDAVNKLRLLSNIAEVFMTDFIWLILVASLAVYSYPPNWRVYFILNCSICTWRQRGCCLHSAFLLGFLIKRSLSALQLD